MIKRWTPEQATNWYNALPFLLGVNYLPATAINSTEMWQAETFDTETIRRELDWASQIGVNALRVFLPFLVWEADEAGFLTRFAAFLALAAEKKIWVMPIFFDDCAFAGKEPFLGKQDDPLPGVHNSGWTPSPGTRLADAPSEWHRLEAYVRSFIGAFRTDARILAWDVYNEPGNEGRGNRSLPLLEAAFDWARGADPMQPITVAIWNETLTDLNRVSLDRSDISSFHRYEPWEQTRAAIEICRRAAPGRPVLCTEWMSRTLGSHVETHLPGFQAEQVGCFAWGLVNGRTQTHFPWGWSADKGEPDVWFHDLLRADGSPYSASEAVFLRCDTIPAVS